MARYRDSKTGKFVSKETWTRSHAQGGTRFKRERRIIKRLPLPQRISREGREEEIERDEEIEYGGAFDSPGGKVKR